MKMVNSITPSACGLSTTPRKRSRISSPLPLVVALKTMLPVTAVTVITMKTRAITAGGSLVILGLRLAGASSSLGA